MSITIETCLADERREQSRWRLKPQCAGIRRFDRLVDNEFISADEHAARMDRLLGEMIGFSVEQVPWYADAFARCGLSSADVRRVDELQRLPMLERHQVVVHHIPEHLENDWRPQRHPGSRPLIRSWG